MTITTKNFKQKLSGVVRSVNTAKTNLQELLVFGLEQYQEHDNNNYLTECVRACIGANALRTSTMKDYIVNATNLTWSKDKNGKPAFKKPKGESASVTWAAIKAGNWWEENEDGQAKPDVDALSKMKGAATAINNAIEQGRIKGGNTDEAQFALDSLNAAIKIIEDNREQEGSMGATQKRHNA